MRQPTVIGTLEFRTKGDAQKYFKAMLDSYKDDERVSDEDNKHLLALLSRHPESERKISAGIDYFYRQRNPNFPSSGFWFARTDGTTDDFNYRMCVSGKAKTPYAEFAAAARWAIRLDIARAKKQAFKQYADSDGLVECEVTGSMVSTDDCEIDHAPPFTFEAILRSFLAANCITPNHNMIDKSVNDGGRAHFKSDGMYWRFRQYHHTLARLRVVSKDANKELAHVNRIRNCVRPAVIDDSYVYPY